jgi:hypothetical protein
VSWAKPLLSLPGSVSEFVGADSVGKRCINSLRRVLPPADLLGQVGRAWRTGIHSWLAKPKEVGEAQVGPQVVGSGTVSLFL